MKKTAGWGSVLIIMMGLVILSAKGVFASPVTDQQFILGFNGGWAFYVGTEGSYSAFRGGAAGEHQVSFEGNSYIGYYFGFPWVQGMSTGTLGNLSGASNAYKAAWLMDQFAPGLGGDWLPEGLSGYSDVDARGGLALAIFEIAMTPDAENYDLEDGFFKMWYGPAESIELGQAYLSALSAATLDMQDLEERYNIIFADETNENWTGYGFSRLIVPVVADDGEPNSGALIPEPLTALLIGGGLLGALIIRKPARFYLLGNRP